MGYRNDGSGYNRHTNPISDYQQQREMILGWSTMALLGAGLIALYAIFDKKDANTANNDAKKTEQVVPPQLQDSTKMTRIIAYDKITRQK